VIQLFKAEEMWTSHVTLLGKKNKTYVKESYLGQVGWLTLVIPATQEAEPGRFVV
jgi:hypothetical protein